MNETPYKREVEPLTSLELAELIVDALIVGGVVDETNLEKALAIAAEEIEARKGVGDY